MSEQWNDEFNDNLNSNDTDIEQKQITEEGAEQKKENNTEDSAYYNEVIGSAADEDSASGFDEVSQQDTSFVLTDETSQQDTGFGRIDETSQQDTGFDRTAEAFDPDEYYFERNETDDSSDSFGQAASDEGGLGSQPPKKKNHKMAKRVAAIATASVLILGAAGGAIYAGINYLKDNFVLKSQMDSTLSNATTATLTKGESTQGNSDGQVLVMDVSGIVKEVKPSVVAITNTLEYNTSDPFAQYFGNGQQSQPQEAKAYGSGVIIGKNDTELLIVTNNHVTAADNSQDNGYSFYSYSSTSKSISVTFIDDATVDATIKGTDEEMDLAVIAVPLKNISADTMATIKVATIGDSNACQEGNGVIAIGNALGAGSSTTVGYISALNREVTIENYTRTLLQTDAAINPGNSGGGLFSTSGQLIGINSAKYSAEEVEGVGYAIPISAAESIIQDLMNQTPRAEVAEDERGYLGIQGRDVPTEYVQSYNFPSGASVSRITSGSPAEKSGLQIYDIITAVNDKVISSYEELRAELNYYKAGETVELTVQRVKGNSFEEKKISVTLTTQADVEQDDQQNQQNQQNNQQP